MMTDAAFGGLEARRKLQSFSLIELLVVMVILGILATGALTAVSYLGERELTNSGTLVASIVDQGRSEALSRSTVVEVCLATGTAAPGAAPYRALSLWAYDQPTSAYVQISKWERLPNSVQIATDPDPYTHYGLTTPAYPGVHITNTAALTNTTTGLALNGQTVNADYFRFLPSGGVQPQYGSFSTNLYFFLVPSKKVSATTLNDWRMVQISTLAGQSKVITP